jgi:hypothetical protein
MMRQSPKPCNQEQGEANPNLVPGDAKYARLSGSSPVLRTSIT